MGPARPICSHRDLAARNVLVSQDAFGEYVVKLGDFGLSKETDTLYYRSKTKEKLPLRWMAPEAIATRRFDESTDVWSFGTTVYEMFAFGALPYASISSADILDYLKKGNRLDRPDACPRELYNILLECWEASPEERPTFAVLHEALALVVPEPIAEERERKTSVGVQMRMRAFQLVQQARAPPQTTTTRPRKGSYANFAPNAAAPEQNVSRLLPQRKSTASLYSNFAEDEEGESGLIVSVDDGVRYHE